MLFILCIATFGYSQHFQIGYRTEAFKTYTGYDAKLIGFNAIEAGIGISVKNKYHLTFYADYGLLQTKHSYLYNRSEFSNFTFNDYSKEYGNIELRQTNLKLGLGHDFRFFKSKIFTFGLSSELIIVNNHRAIYYIKERYGYTLDGSQEIINSPIEKDFVRVDELRRNKIFYHPFIFNFSARLLKQKLILSLFFHGDNISDNYDPKNSSTYGLKILYRYDIKKIKSKALDHS